MRAPQVLPPYPTYLYKNGVLVGFVHGGAPYPAPYTLYTHAANGDVLSVAVKPVEAGQNVQATLQVGAAAATWVVTTAG